jgi:hypothetical protein
MPRFGKNEKRPIVAGAPWRDPKAQAQRKQKGGSMAAHFLFGWWCN